MNYRVQSGDGRVIYGEFNTLKLAVDFLNEVLLKKNYVTIGEYPNGEFYGPEIVSKRTGRLMSFVIEH